MFHFSWSEEWIGVEDVEGGDDETIILVVVIQERKQEGMEAKEWSRMVG